MMYSLRKGLLWYVVRDDLDQPVHPFRLISIGKCPKISNTLFHTFFAQISLFIQLFLKILSRKANSVDPDLTAPSGAV